MTRVLLLAYYWPPSGGSGVQRWLKLSRYLPGEGINPVVITPASGTAPYYDNTLLGDVPEGLEVIKTGSLEPFALYNRLMGRRRDAPIPVGMMGISEETAGRAGLAAWVRGNLFIPDARLGWAPFAYRVGLARLRQGGIEAIISTGPPHSTHLAARALARRTGLPWLADLRDPWTNIYYNRQLPRSRWARALDARLESSVLAKASAVTVVSPGMAREFAPPRSRRVEVVYNGFDEADFAGPAPARAGSHFLLAHIGNFFPSLEAPGLTRALARLVRELPSFANTARVRFTGLVDEGVYHRMTEAGLGQIIEREPPVDHAIAVNRMRSADALLFSLARVGDAPGLISGKLFEYLASGTPILAISPPDSGAALLLAESGAAPPLDYDDEQGLYTWLHQAWEIWRVNGPAPATQGPTEAAAAYSRRAQAGQMAGLIRELVGKTKRA